jgi:hypothetical protein
MASTNPKLNSSLKSILYNQWILYFISFLAIVDFIALCGMKDWFSVVVFASVGFLVTFFNKNMIVVLSIAMAVTHILKYGIQHSRVHEGFESSEEHEQHEQYEQYEQNEEHEQHEEHEEHEEHEQHEETVDDNEKKEHKSKMSQFKELKQEFPEFKKIQEQILEGVNKMNPLLNKAESFIEKFNDYKSS